MLQLKKVSSNRKSLVFLLMGLFVIMISLGIFFYLHHDNKTNPIDVISTKPQDGPSLPSKSYQQDDDAGASQVGVEGVNTSEDTAGGAAFPTTKPLLSIAVTSTNQSQTTLSVITQVSPKASGTCTFELSQSGRNVLSKTVALHDNRCTDPLLDIGTLPAGEWSLTAKVFVGENVATATSLVTLR